MKELSIRPAVWWGLCGIAAVGLVAIALALVAGHYALRSYRGAAEVRLNPANLERYSRENMLLGSPETPRVVFFGDSRVERWSPRPEWPGTKIVWRGLGGETTAQLLLRFDMDVLALRPRVVVLQAGINDVIAGVAVDRGAEAARAAVARLRQMAQAAAAGGAAVYLLTIVRPGPASLIRRAVWSDEVLVLVKEVNEQLRRSESERVHVIDADTLLSDGAEVLPGKYAQDTVHFTVAAYSRLNGVLRATMSAADNAVQ